MHTELHTVSLLTSTSSQTPQLQAAALSPVAQPLSAQKCCPMMLQTCKPACRRDADINSSTRSCRGKQQTHVQTPGKQLPAWPPDQSAANCWTHTRRSPVSSSSTPEAAWHPPHGRCPYTGTGAPPTLPSCRTQVALTEGEQASYIPRPSAGHGLPETTSMARAPVDTS